MLPRLRRIAPSRSRLAPRLPSSPRLPLPTSSVGTSYAALLDVSGGGTFTFSLSSGRLPDGLTLSPAGSITGVPTRQGTFDFVIVATDNQGNSPVKSFTIQIQPSPLVVADPNATLTVGTPANIALTITGGVTTLSPRPRLHPAGRPFL